MENQSTLFSSAFDAKVVPSMNVSILQEGIPDKDTDFQSFYDFQSALIPQELLAGEPTLRGVHESDGVLINLFSLDLHETIIRSFKGAGAFCAMWRMKKDGHKEVVTCSAGNHAQGVAYAAAKLGIHANIYMPKGTSDAKVNATKDLGGTYVTVHLEGDSYDDAARAAKEHQCRDNIALVHPFDDEDVIDGQGVHFYKLWKLMELNRQKIDLALVPGGGGGLLSGTASVRGKVSPETVIVGVEGEGSDCIAQGLDIGEPKSLEAVNGYAQGMAVKTVGSRTLKTIEENRQVDDFFVTVNSGEIAMATTEFGKKNERVETAGATATAALMNKKVQLLLEKLVHKAKKDGRKQVNVVSFVSGGNITPEEQVQRKFEAEIYSGIQRHYEIELPENKPGTLQSLTAFLAEKNINIRALDYSTNQLQTKDGRPFVTMGLQPREGKEVLLDEVESWMGENNYRYNDISAKKAAKVAHWMKKNLPVFTKEHASKKTGYSKISLQIKQQPGSLDAILQKFTNNNINVELYNYEERSQEEDWGNIQIGISRENGQIFSETEIQNILGDEYVLNGAIEDIK